MRVISRARLSAVIALISIFSIVAAAQWDKKPSAQWTDKDIEKLLTDSPWAKKLETASSNILGVPNSGTSNRAPVANTGTDAQRNQDLPRGSASSDISRSGEGSITRSSPSDASTASTPIITSLTLFSVKLLSAKPVREAFSRGEYNQQSGDYFDKLLDTLNKNTDLIFISVGGRVGSRRLPSASLLNGTTSSFEGDTFLEVKGGQRIALKEFLPARDANIGGIFVFPRLVDGKPFITPEIAEIRFLTKIDKFKLVARYKVKDLMYEGNLEY